MKNLIFAAAFILGILFPVFGKDYPKLQTYNVDPSTITISGISSGGGFVTQYHFSYSSQITGTGIFEGGAYPCLTTDQANNCMKTPEKTNITKLNAIARDYANKGLIDPLRGMQGTKVYVFHGKNDTVVPWGAGQNVVDQYTALGAQVLAELSLNAGHGQPVDDGGKYGGPCDGFNKDNGYINDCGYNGAYEMLNFFFGGNLIRPASDYTAEGRIDDFNQLEFTTFDPLIASMDKMGYVYVPKNCQNGTTTCKLHIAFHGCGANYGFAGYGYALHSQYAEVADQNDIVILFPQSARTLLNTRGCWDVAGYTGKPDYATKRGKQISAVYQMMNRILGV